MVLSLSKLKILQIHFEPKVNSLPTGSREILPLCLSYQDLVLHLLRGTGPAVRMTEIN
jgi:hypothetical protein